jgi:hypothetical protein
VFSQSIPRVSSVKTQLIYCQLKWLHVSSQGVIIRPITEPFLRYIKGKLTLLLFQKVYNNASTWESTYSHCCKYFGIPKCTLSLDEPQTCFNNWPDDESLSRNMSPHL